MKPIGSLDYSIIEELKRLGKRSPDFLADLIKPFLMESHQIISEMETSLSELAWPDLKFQSHRYRATCGGLGASRMAELCVFIERASQAADVAVVRASLQELSSEFAKVRIVIQSELLPKQ